MGSGGRGTKRLESTAFHEAGHAVAARLLGHAVKRVTIVPEPGETLGGCRGSHVPRWFHPEVGLSARVRRWAEARIMVLMAGGLAEGKFRGQHCAAGCEQDVDIAGRLAEMVSGSAEEAQKFLDWLHVRAKNLLDVPEHWRAVCAVGAALLERGTLNGADVRRLVDGAAVAEQSGEESGEKKPEAKRKSERKGKGSGGH